MVVYGAGGFAREVAWLVQSMAQAGDDIEPVAFIDDSVDTRPDTLNGLPVLGLGEALDAFPDAQVAVAIGDPATREKVTRTALDAGFSSATLIAPDVRMSEFVSVAEGSVVCAGNILTTNISIGRGAQINLDCTIGHDVRMGEYTTLAPGVHVSGWVHFGARVYVGTGAVIINGTSEAPLTLGDGAVVGAGACVTKSVDPGVTVVGVPAKPR